SPCQLRAVVKHPHFSVQPLGARIDIVRSDKAKATVEGESLGVQAGITGGARTESEEAGGMASLARIGLSLDFVKLDSRLEQRLAVALVTGMHRHSVRGRQGIGDDDDPDAAPS